MGRSSGVAYVQEALFNADTVLAADTDDTPAALAIAEQRLLGRITAGDIVGLTAAQIRTLINVADGATAGGGWELIDATYQASGTTITITIPANTLAVDGEHLYIDGLWDSTAATQIARLSWNGTVIAQASGSDPLDAGDWGVCTAWVRRTGAAAQTCSGHMFSHVTGANGLVTPNGGTVLETATLSGTVDILADWVTAGTNAVISLKVWKVTL